MVLPVVKFTYKWDVRYKVPFMILVDANVVLYQFTFLLNIMVAKQKWRRSVPLPVPFTRVAESKTYTIKTRL